MPLGSDHRPQAVIEVGDVVLVDGALPFCAGYVVEHVAVAVKGLDTAFEGGARWSASWLFDALQQGVAIVAKAGERRGEGLEHVDRLHREQPLGHRVRAAGGVPHRSERLQARRLQNGDALLQSVQGKLQGVEGEPVGHVDRRLHGGNPGVRGPPLLLLEAGGRQKLPRWPRDRAVSRGDGAQDALLL